jgi:hypothetical protein
MNLVLWVVQGLLALSCVFSGLSKAFRPLAKVHQQFPWANHVPAALVRFIGVSELLGGSDWFCLRRLGFSRGGRWLPLPDSRCSCSVPLSSMLRTGNFRQSARVLCCWGFRC